MYLRGFLKLIQYIKEGHKLDPLFIGKISYEHIPIIHELKQRKILLEPPLKPRYMDQPEVIERLAALQKGVPMKDIIMGVKK